MTLALNLGNDLYGATFSPDRRYRYRLWRRWGPANGRRVCFVGVNPSTADESADDATIRKCIGFAKRWGFDALDMVNLFAWRDTDQRGLLTAGEPIGVENDVHILEAFDVATRIVFAWGSGKTAAVRQVIATRFHPVFPWAEAGRKVGTLGRTSDGSPRHPLMLAYTTPFQPL